MENPARNFYPYSLSREPLKRPKNRSGWLILDIFKIFGIIEVEEEKIYFRKNIQLAGDDE